MKKRTLKNRFYLSLVFLIISSCNTNERGEHKVSIDKDSFKSEIKQSSRIGSYILNPPENWQFQNFDSIAYLIKDSDTISIRSSKNLDWGFKHSLYAYINSKNILTKSRATMITNFDNLKSKFYRHAIQYKDKEYQKWYYAIPANPEDGYTELFIQDKLNHHNLSVSAKNLSPEEQDQIKEFFENIKYSPQGIHITELKQECDYDFQFLPVSYNASKIIDTCYTQDTLKIKYAFVTNCGDDYNYDIVSSADKDSIILKKAKDPVFYTRAKIQNRKIISFKQEQMNIVLSCLCESIVQINIAGLKLNNKYKIEIIEP